MEFNNWDHRKIDEYQAQAETLYGKSEAWQEYTQKAKKRTKEQNKDINNKVMDFFVELGKIKHLPPDSAEAQTWVKELQEFFTENFYTCTPQILQGLGEMYAGGGSMTEHIAAAGGAGTGEFARDAIQIYCK